MSVFVNFDDPARAEQFLRGLPRRDFTREDVARLLPVLMDALRHSPDPDRALAAFARWLAACDAPRQYLSTLEQPGVLHRFCFVTGCSQYFADLLAHTPADFDILAHPQNYGERKTSARRYLEISHLTQGCDTLQQQGEVLRRWKARAMLQIGVRDLLGLDAMPTAAREFSHLADACVQIALDIASASACASFKETGEAGTEKRAASPAASPLFPENPLAVIALGKLGGQELNYSSDIDLMFVHQDGLPSHVTLPVGRRIETPVYLARVAENVIRILNSDTALGHVFRVDMRLRPEGRSGPLTRSLAGCRAYYEKWAENWERQALLKARFAAGNHVVGESFEDIITPIVFRRQISGAFLNEIRLNKRRIEQTCEGRGEEQTNIKTGYGGIRDIEFIVQMLQLEFGGRQPRLRSSSTLTALTRLNEAGYLPDRDTQELGDDYQWLRTLEHRLQLLHNAQTQLLPPYHDERARTHLARRMGYATRDAFTRELTQRRDRARAYLNALFYDQDRRFYPQFPDTPDPLWHDVGDLLDTLDTAESRHLLGERLTQAGFQNAPDALRLLALLRNREEFRDTAGQPSELFRPLAPFLLDMAAHSPDPNAALEGVESLAVPYRDTLYSLFRGRPDLMWRVVRLASVPPLISRLARHQEWMLPLLSADEYIQAESADEANTDEIPPPVIHNAGEPLAEQIHARAQSGETTPDETLPDETLPQAAQSLHYARELQARIEKLSNPNAQWKMIALFYQRERLRIAAQDVWDEADVTDVMTRLTRLTEAVLHVLLRVCARSRALTRPDPETARRVLAQVALVGMGRLGGGELNYGSDWDLLFVYDVERPRIANEAQGERSALVSGLAQDVLAAVEALNLHGANIVLDLRLRPWGRQGSVIHSVRGYVDYFDKHAQTWERQAALKARYVAGNARTGRRLERVLRALSSRRGITRDEDAAIQAMKTRIETERLSRLERDTNLKLGHGGLSDIEWLVQRLQLLHGPAAPAVRTPNTLRALDALEALRALDRSEASVLTSAYRLLTRARNAMTLLAGTPQDVFPGDPARRRVAARLLGYEDSVLLRAEDILQEALQADMQAVRRIFEWRFVDSRDSPPSNGII